MQTMNDVPIINALKPAKITVTSLDVERGDSKAPGACPAARACCHTLHASAARVYISTTFVELPAKTARHYCDRRSLNAITKRGPVWVRFRTPSALRTEVMSMDRSKTFDPGEYTLPPIQPSHRATGRRIGGNGKGKVSAVAARTNKKGRIGGNGKGKVSAVAARTNKKGRKPYKRPAPRHVLGGVRKFDSKKFAESVAAT